MRLASWAAIAVADGLLSAQRGHLVVVACKEYRFASADAGVMQRARELIEQAERDAKEFAELRRLKQLGTLTQQPEAR